MLIDWFTVAAQIVNFLVLVALMRRFLYGPLIRAIDEREASIAARLAEAEEKNRAASESVAQATARQAELDQTRERILAAARDDAERRHGEMLQNARASVHSIETAWHAELDLEKEVFLDEMRRRAATEILAVTRRALAGLAGAELEHTAIEAFLAQLRRLDPASLETLAAGEISVATAAELPEDTRSRIREAIEARAGSSVRLRFESVPAMSWGIELRGGGRRIGWTPDIYLDSLEANMEEYLTTSGDLGGPAGAEAAA